MKKLLVSVLSVALMLMSFAYVPYATAAPTYSLYSVSLDAPTYTSDPGATTVDATITLTLNYLNDVASSQTFTGTAYLIRDDVVVDTSAFSVSAPSTVVTSTTRTVTVALNTGASTISYLKLKVDVKDSYTGVVKSTYKLLYVSNAGYKMTDLSVSSVKVPYGDVVQAKVYDYNGNPTDGYPGELIYAPTGAVINTATVTSGILLMVANITDEGDYILKSGLAKAVIKARYNFQLTAPTSAVLSGDPVVISGKVTDANNNPVSGVSMCLYNTSDNSINLPVITIGSTSSNGLFAGVWSTTGHEPGTYYVGVCGLYHGHDYASVVLKPRTFSLTSNVSEVYAGLPRTQTIELTLKNGSDPLGNASVYYTVKNNSTVIYNNVSVSTDPNGVFSITLPVGLSTGNISVSVNAETSAGVWGEASINIPVVLPQKISYQLSGLSNPLHVQDYTVVVNALSNVNPPNTIDYIKVSISGPAIAEGLDTSRTGTISNGGSFVLKVLSYGTVKITLDSTDSAGNRVVKTYSYSVDGYKVQYNKTQFTVGDKATIIVKVTDGSGTPINNAYVKLVASRTGVFDTSSGVVDTMSINGAVSNVVGGNYIFTATLLKSADIDVFVYKSDGTTLMYRGYKVLTINPILDLQMTVSPEKVIGGFSTPVKVGVRDKNGNGVDAYVYLKDEEGNVLSTQYVSASNPTTTFTVLMNPGEKYEVFALSTDASHGAKKYIEAYPVMINFSPQDGLITAGEKEAISATLLNPFNNLPISVDSISITPINAELQNVEGSLSVSNTSGIKATFTASVLNTSTDAFVEVKVVNEGKVLFDKKLKIVPPVLKVSPPYGYVGVSNSFNIQLTDAHNQPLAGRLIKVYQGSTIVGNVTTGADGKAVFNYNAANTGILTFKYGKYASVDVVLQVDMIAPEILSITPSTGTTVHKNRLDVMVVVKEEQTYVKEVIAKNITTGDITYGIFTQSTGTITARLILRLAEGENTFVIQAIDAAGNVSNPVFYKVTYEIPVDNTPPQIVSINPANGSTLTEDTVKVMMSIEDDTALDAVYVDYEPIQKNIMMKKTVVYFTLKLKEGKNVFNIVVTDKAGNITKYDYVLYYHNPTVEIVLRIGSQFYKVKGKTKIMDAAPFIDPRYSRTMVPLRFIAEALGLNVGWDKNTRMVTVTGTLGGVSKEIKIPMGDLKKVKITLGGQQVYIYESTGIVYVDGMKVDIAKAGWGKPLIYQNRTFVPIRFIAEIFGCQVDWLPPDTIKITYTP